GRVRPARGRGRCGHDPHRPAEDERPRQAGPGGDPGRRRRGDRARRRPCRGDLRRRAGVRGRRGHQGDGRHVVRRHGQAVRRPAVRVHRGRPHPQAGRRGGHRLRARGRLRAGPVRRHPDRRRQRDPGAARDPARHHPRRRRHPTSHPPRRPQQGQGPHLQRTVRQGAGGPRDRARRPARAGRRRLHRGGRLGAAVHRCGGAGAAGRQGVGRPRARGRPRHRTGDRASAIRGPVRHRGQVDRHAVIRGERTGQGAVHRTV
ncbi:MAG: Enoyl-CoA hydratase, partial [uncultured Nocardioidaceae bacterium]